MKLRDRKEDVCCKREIAEQSPGETSSIKVIISQSSIVMCWTQFIIFVFYFEPEFNVWSNSAFDETLIVLLTERANGWQAESYAAILEDKKLVKSKMSNLAEN